MKNMYTKFWLSRIALLFVILFSTIVSSMAQSPMYVNTPTPGGNCNSFPFNNTTTSRKVQFLYLANEFTGAPGGAINKVWIRPCGAVTNTVYNNFSVRLRQEPSTLTAFASGNFLTPAQTCFTAATFSFTTVANGWYPISLSTPFVYDPSKTLIIEFEHSGYTGTGFSINQTSTTNNRRIWGDYQAAAGTAGTAYANMGIDVVSLGANDIGISNIDSPGVFCSPNQNIVATVTNYGVNQVTGFNVHWSLNGVTQNTLVSTATLDTLGGAGSNKLQVVLGNYTFPTASSTLIKAWTSMPNGQNDTVRINDTSAVSRIPAMPGGNYTIGGSGPNNFATFDAAISAMTTGGICGPVVFTVAPGNYTRTTAIILPDIMGSSPVNTITFDGVTAAACSLSGSINSSGIVIFNSSKYVTFKNFTVINNATTVPVAVAAVGATRKITISKCVASVPIQGGTSTTGYGIIFTGTANGAGVSACPADSALIDSNTVIGGGYSITHYGSSNTGANRGIVITNNIVNNSNYMGGYIAYNYNPIICTGNTFNMQGGSYGYYGLYFYYNYSAHPSAAHVVANNRINNFGGYGMYVYYPMQTTATTARVRIYNNVLNSAINGTYYGYYGINVTSIAGAVPIDVFHNTSVMNGPSTSATYSAFYSSGSTAIVVKNNIFAIYAGSYTPAYFATNPTGNVINYNLYYNGANPTTGALVYRVSSLTPANYKTAAGGGDSSFNSAPSFISRLPLPGNLALTDACNGVGVDLSAVTPTDYNGVTRAVTPTLGAYEFTGALPNSIAVMSLLNPAPPISTGAQDLRFIVKNVGSNTVNSYMANYKNNNGTPVSQLMTNSLAPCALDTPTFTSTNQITLGPSNQIVVYTASPNFSADPNPNDDTLKVSLFAPLSGTYTVGGTAPDFATIQEAANALQYGLAGPVVFDIRPGTYNGKVTVQGPAPGLSAVNTVTFEGNDASTRIVTANVAEGVFVINGLNYIAVRNLTINNTSTANCAGIVVVGSGSSNAGTGCKIVKNIVNLPIQSGTTTNGWGINVTANSSGTGVTAMRADSVLIDSNIITGGAYAIAVYGASNTLYNRNIVITNNKVYNNNYMGGYIAYNYNPVIVNDNEFNMQGFNYGYYGLYFYYNYSTSTTTSHEIRRNKIFGFGGYGIYAYYPAQSASVAKTKIYNNLVISGTGTNYPGYYGINVGSPSGAIPVEVFHNTVTMNGAATSTTYSCLYMSGSTAVSAKNNIFAVYNGSTTPVYCSTAPTGNIINYNIYYNATNTATGSLIYRNGVFYNPTNYLSATVGGDSSWNMLPPFVGSTNFNITNGCIRGVNLNSDVPADINGLMRSANPNPGCYEYPGVALDITPTSVLAPSYPVTLGTQDLRILVRNNGSNTVTGFTISYRLNNGTPVTAAFSGTLNSCDTASVLFTGANAINLVNQVNNLTVYTSSPNFSADLNPGNDTLVTTLSTPLTGNFVIGSAPSDYATFNAAFNALKSRGASGVVNFNVKTGVYNEQLELTDYLGSNAPGTMVWFKSQAGNRDSVRLEWNSITGQNYVVKFGGVNQIGFKDMTIAQLAGNVTCYNLLYTGSNSYDSIENCRLANPVYGVNGTSSTYIIYNSGGTGTGLSWKNNRMVGSYYGFYIYGQSASPLRYVNFDSNTVDSIAYSPMYYFYYTNYARVTNNNFTQRSLGFTSYCYFYYNDSAFQFTNNRMYSEGSGMYLYMYYLRNTLPHKALIANNMISGSTAHTTCYYYMAGYSQNVGIYHNSFSLATASGYGPIIYNISSSNIDVANNIFSNYNTNGSGSYAIYTSTGLTSNNNNIAKASLAGTLAYEYSPVLTATTLPSWILGNPGLETNSISYRPGFTSNTNLIPNAADSAVWSINGRAKVVLDVPNDFNGTPRHASVLTGVSDLGAMEVTPTSIPPLATAVPAVPAANTTQVFLFGQDTVCTILYDQFATAPASVDVRQYSGVKPPLIGAATGYMNFYVDAQAPAGFYNYTMNLYYFNDWMGTITNKADLRLAKKNMTGPWQVYLFTASSVDTTRGIITAPFLNDFSYFTGADNGNPLPVKLTQFVGNKVADNASLNWITAAERNSKLFEVERSVDGKMFTSIAKVNAQGNSSANTSYNYTDRNVFNANTKVIYYRLKMVDLDGSSEYSQVIAIRNSNEANRLDAVNVYPNPFNSNVQILDLDKTVTEVLVQDVNGRVVFKQSFDLNSSDKSISLPSSLESGIYFFTLNNQRTLKLIKQ